MERLLVLALSALSVSLAPTEADTVLSSVLTPEDTKLSRQGRSYGDPRYGTGRPYEYGRLNYDRPARCGRCDDRDDRDDDRDDDYGRRRGYDDDGRHRVSTFGNRYDTNKGDRDDDRYSNDRNNSNKNGTDDEGDKDKNRYHDKDDRPSGGRRDRDRNRDRGRDRDRNRDRDRYDERDRYRPDYYDRDRDRYDRDRPYYDDPYRERRPLYERYPEDPYGRYDGYGYGYRRPAYDDRYDRVGAYDDGYGGYGPGAGRGPHDRYPVVIVRDRYDYGYGSYGYPQSQDYDRYTIRAYYDSFGGYGTDRRGSDSFRPWDETYRGQAGWDAGGRGYYFASGRPDAAPAQPWGRPEYARPQYSESGWQNVGYSSGGYRDPLEYRGSLGYGSGGYRQDLSSGYAQPTVYGQSSGWRNVGERRPYRDQSGVAQLDSRGGVYPQPSRQTYGQAYPQPGQGNGYSNANSVYANGNSAYGSGNSAYGSGNSAYATGNSAYPIGNSAYSNSNGAYSSANSYTSSSTTPNTNYLFQREDERVTAKVADETTKVPQTS